MRRVALASFAAVFAVSGIQGASAADIPAARTKAPMMVPVAFTWTGFYIGGNVGGSWAAGDITYANPFLSVNTENGGSSLIGGAQIGYNWQSGPAVFGIEADIQWRKLEENSVFLAPTTLGVAGAPFGTVAGDNVAFHHQQNWLGTVRARLGYAAGQFMPYVTGGLAYGDVEQAYTERLVAPNATTARTISSSSIEVGWTVGAGFEWAFSNQWSLGAEYLYVDLGDTTLALAASVPGPTATAFRASAATFENTSHIARAKLNFRFSAR